MSDEINLVDQLLCDITEEVERRLARSPQLHSELMELFLAGKRPQIAWLLDGFDEIRCLLVLNAHAD